MHRVGEPGVGIREGTGRVLTSLTWRLEPAVIVGLAPRGRVSVWGGRQTLVIQEAGRLVPHSTSWRPPQLSLQRIRQLVCPAEDLAQRNQAGPSASATPRTSLLRLTELESHC